MRPIERVLALAARKCRDVSNEISEAIIAIEHQRAAAGRILGDRTRPMGERNNALLEFEECDEVIRLLKDFKDESLVASEVLLRGSALAFLTFIEDFVRALEQRPERALHLAFKRSASFEKFVQNLGSLSATDQPSDEN